MSGTWVFLGGVGLALIAGLVWAWRIYSGKGEVKRLRQEYARLIGQPPARAYDSLERRIEALMKAQPGRSMTYYLQTIVNELKRDRR